MLFLMILFLFTKASCTPDSNGGSVLFYKKSSKECWNQDDLAKLRARKIFEKIVLPTLPPEKMSSKYNKEILKYYRKALHVVDKDEDRHNAKILKEALADTLGGHMRCEMLPSVRFSYYAGYVSYRSAKQMHTLYDDLKTFLNTKGIGWNPPEKTPIQSNLTVGKILIGAGKPFDPCAFLVVKRNENNCIHIPTPKVDDETEPTAIVLPFKIGGFVSLTSQSSENILLKYYTTSARCILRSSPQECKHTDFVNYNNELWHWMKRHVAPHLLDEKLYAAYGGVLRIAAAVQNYGKGLSRRNLYESDDLGSSNKWCPWKALKDQQLNIDADWSPQLYIALVLGAALAICFLQICYNYILGRANGCRCSGRKRSYDKDIAYATVDSNFPAMLPSHQSGGSSNDQKRDRDHRSVTRSKTASVGTVRTRVYDFNENTEKIMSVIMSDNEGTDVESTSNKESEEEVRTKTGVGSVQTQTNVKPRSPPKIEAPIAQLKIEKTAQAEKARPMCSTSTVTQSEVTYCGQVSDTAWSGSYTTESSVSTKSHTQRTRRSRDLAWARRVVSKHTVNDQNTKSFTGTDYDLRSFTTPPSRR
ncbi:uncharacterized protein LOC126382094 [Pectinophora gossypiella]|uniref:uncharacterized protein LOC126382094 n=1 Tax=Pectinophora gossypiella TaxID=13191 RepID=UPI00214E88AB|nr:uncharacterized protein LOC126382094 [Pectinophora gossypiella]